MLGDANDEQRHKAGATAETVGNVPVVSLCDQGRQAIPRELYSCQKIFAYYLDNHHGDGIVGLLCKTLPGDNKRLIAASPRKFYMPAYVGPRGWVGLRLDRPTVDWAEVKELVRGSYLQTAPKKLIRLLEQT